MCQRDPFGYNRRGPTDLCVVEPAHIRSMELSPDGLCALASSNDNFIRLYEIPTNPHRYNPSGICERGTPDTGTILFIPRYLIRVIYPSKPLLHISSQHTASASRRLFPVLKFKEPDTIIDIAWNPLMNSQG